MAGPPPEQNGVNFFVTWGLIEWALTAMLTMGGAVAAWVWHLAGRVEKLERLAEAERREIELMRKTLREIGSQLDKKIDTETERLEHRMDRQSEKLEEVREAVPSRQFIEAQINNLQGRIDRSLDSRGLPQQRG